MITESQIFSSTGTKPTSHILSPFRAFSLVLLGKLAEWQLQSGPLHSLCSMYNSWSVTIRLCCVVKYAIILSVLKYVMVIWLSCLAGKMSGMFRWRICRRKEAWNLQHQFSVSQYVRIIMLEHTSGSVCYPLNYGVHASVVSSKF